MDAGGDISAGECQALDWLASQNSAMVGLLERLVNIDSGTYNKTGTDAVGELICRFLDENGIPFDVIPNDKFGYALRASVGSGGRPILLMGHRDTVFPDGEARRRPFRIDGARGYGPGVADMKAGLVMNSFVAAALKKFDVSPA